MACDDMKWGAWYMGWACLLLRKALFGSLGDHYGVSVRRTIAMLR